MLDWLSSFGDFIINIIEFFISFFRNVVELCVLVFKGFSYISTIILYMPTQYQVVFIAFLSFSVIVAIVHFGG